jgi:hypothetical protein
MRALIAFQNAGLLGQRRRYLLRYRLMARAAPESIARHSILQVNTNDAADEPRAQQRNECPRAGNEIAVTSFQDATTILR